MYTLRSARLTLLFGLALSVFAQTAKRPLNHRDYDGWRTIQSQALSRDGKFLAYSLVPEEGDGQLVVRNLATGQEIRENCGSAPPAGPESGEETPSEGPPAVRGIRIVFTHDNAFLVAGAFPSKAETDQAKKDHKRADEMPRNGMIIVDLSTLKATRVPDVASFEVPELGASFAAYLHGPKPRAGAGAAPDDGQDQARRAGGSAAGGRARNRYGSDLVLRDLRSGKERTFDDVLEYSMAKDAGTLLYAVRSRKEDTDGLYSVVPGTDAAPVSLLAGKGRYTKLTWDFAGRRLAFLSDRDDQASKPPKFKAYLWDRSGAPAEVISTATAGFHAGYGILDRGPVSFSRDGSHLFVSCAPLEEIAALEKEPAPARQRWFPRMRRSSRICGAGKMTTYSPCRRSAQRRTGRVPTARCTAWRTGNFFSFPIPRWRAFFRATTAAWRWARTIAPTGAWWITTETIPTSTWWIRRRAPGNSR